MEDEHRPVRTGDGGARRTARAYADRASGQREQAVARRGGRGLVVAEPRGGRLVDDDRAFRLESGQRSPNRLRGPLVVGQLLLLRDRGRWGRGIDGVGQRLERGLDVLLRRSEW